MSKEILKLSEQPIISNGRISYNEAMRCNNLIALRKEIRIAFPALNDINLLFYYRLEYYKSSQELLKRVTELSEKNDGLPFLFFIFEDKCTNNQS